MFKSTEFKPGILARTRRAAIGAVLGVAALAAPSMAGAQVSGTLSFVQPSGTVAATDSIPIYLRLTLDANSAPVITDTNGELVTPVFSNAEISSFNTNGVSADPTQPYNEFVNVSYGCEGTFLANCTGTPAPYTIDFNYDPGSFIDPANLNLQPGATVTFLYATFNPVGGVAAPGTYSFFDAGIVHQFYQASTGVFGFQTLFATGCPADGSGCVFTRTVAGAAPVPEPASWTMMLGALAVGGVAVRRRGQRVRRLAAI